MVTFDGKAWIIGGRSDNRVTYNSYALHFDFYTWERQPELIYARELHACAVMDNGDTEMIVVAGGYGEFGNVLDTVEILKPNSYWERGKKR